MPRANIIKDLPAVSEGTIDADLAGLEVVRAANQKINEINVVATSIVLTAFVSMVLSINWSYLLCFLSLPSFP